MSVEVKPWPKLLRDVRRTRGRTKRDISTGLVVIAKGTTGTIETAGNGWNLLQFTADKCGACGCQPRATRLSKSDLEMIGEALI